jgi:hypothetical protein
MAPTYNPRQKDPSRDPPAQTPPEDHHLSGLLSSRKSIDGTETWINAKKLSLPKEKSEWMKHCRPM